MILLFWPCRVPGAKVAYAGTTDVVTGDFNGDGMAGDSVHFKPGADGQGYTLIARFAGDDGKDVSSHEHTLSHMDHLRYIGLRLAPSDVYENPCTRGAYESCGNMLESITTASDNVTLYKEEAFETLFFWHGDTGEFLRHPLSD